MAPIPWRAAVAASSAGVASMRVWRSYERILARRPVLTQTITSAALWTLGDVAAQRLDSETAADPSSPGDTSTSQPLSGRHVAASAAYGAAVVGPIGHAWYRFLDAWVAARLPRGSARFVAAKVLLDEIVFGPVHVAGFFAAVTLAEGGGVQAVKAKLSRDFWPTYAAELAFWPAFQALNFWRVPVRHQLLVVNLACLLDATFLCWVSRNDLAGVMASMRGEKVRDKEVGGVPPHKAGRPSPAA